MRSAVPLQPQRMWGKDPLSALEKYNMHLLTVLHVFSQDPLQTWSQQRGTPKGQALGLSVGRSALSRNATT